jgi:hypothetical protein
MTSGLQLEVLTSASARRYWAPSPGKTERGGCFYRSFALERLSQCLWAPRSLLCRNSKAFPPELRRCAVKRQICHEAPKPGVGLGRRGAGGATADDAQPLIGGEAAGQRPARPDAPHFMRRTSFEQGGFQGRTGGWTIIGPVQVGQRIGHHGSCDHKPNPL